jgi:PilZ domain-containing protein
MAHLGNGLEHRWGERFQVNIPVRVSTADLTIVVGCMKNLSLSGALMKSDCDLRLHSLIEVWIELPSPSPRAAVVNAHVSRKLKEEVGIEWCEFAPNVVKDLLRFSSSNGPARLRTVAAADRD